MDFCDRKILELKDNALYNDLLNTYCKEFNIKDRECARSIAHMVDSYKNAFLGLGSRDYEPRKVMNYDFTANWYSKIVPLLDRPEIQKAIRQGCSRLNANNFRDVPPASHCGSDAYATLSLDMQDNFFNDLNDGNVPDSLREDYDKYLQLAENDDDDDDDDDDNQELYELQEKMFLKHFCWKTHISSYVVIGACHEWNSTFGLALAKLVEPDEKWYVKRGPNHTTVINKSHTKCFDINMWGIKYLHYYCGLTREALKDPTFAGTDAYEYAFGIGNETVEAFAGSLLCKLGNYKLVPLKGYGWDRERYNEVVIPILKKYVNTV